MRLVLVVDNSGSGLLPIFSALQSLRPRPKGAPATAFLLLFATRDEFRDRESNPRREQGDCDQLCPPRDLGGLQHGLWVAEQQQPHMERMVENLTRYLRVDHCR